MPVIMRRKKLPTSKIRDLKSILRACRWHRVPHHHHESWLWPPYDEMIDLQNAVVLVYSSQYGPWQLAINQDGSISKPGDQVPRPTVPKGPRDRKPKEGCHD